MNRAKSSSKRILMVVAGLSVASGAYAECNEGCLDKVMHSYLDQLVKHDPKSLPVSDSVVAIENGKPVKLGEGLWQSVTSVPGGVTVADVVSEQVVYAGATRIGDKVGALFLRLKVAGGKITESEIVSRGGEPGASSDFSGLLEPDILYDATVPQARRSDRRQLTAVVDKYMDAISKHDGSLASFSYRCDRYSAGSKFTNNAAVPAEHGGGSCPSSLNGLKGQEVVNRRYAAIDVDRGLVAALFIIPHGERPVPGATNVAEIFKVVDGKIRSIEEYSFVGGFPPSSGFPDR